MQKNRTAIYLILILLVCLSINSSLTGALAQEMGGKAPISHEAMWLMKRVGAPQPSPDGKWVVFSLTEPSYDEREQVSDLWIVPTDGSAKPRRLTSTKGGESGIAWSPDSRKIAFSARREGDETGQIYVLNITDGGESIRVTSLSTGARSPRWRPDGKALLFTSTVYPGAMNDDDNKKIAAERKARKYNARVYDGFPVRYWDHWLDDKEPHLFIQELDTNAKAKDLLAGTALVKGQGFAGSSSDELGAQWSPDGQTILFIATTEKNTAAFASFGSHIFQMPASGGEPKQLTKGDFSYAQLKFRPDGKALYATRTREGGGKPYYLSRLIMLSWPASGEPLELTTSFDRSVGDFDFTPDNRTVYLLAEESGNEKLYEVPAAGGEVKLAVDQTRGVFTNLSIPPKAGSTLVLANWESAINPAEIVRIDLNSKAQTPLTQFNTEAASKIDWLPLRHFWHTSKAGKRIHSMVALPPGFDENKKYPLFVLIHGGPHGMWRDQFFLRWNYHLFAQPGFVVLLTDYTGSTGYGEKFAQDILGDPFKGPADEINEAADEAIRQFKFIDASRQAAGGASYGGHLANWLQATTTRYKCLISHAGLINLESQWGTSDTIYHREVNSGGPHWEGGKTWREQNPIRFAANFRTPILLTVGENDFRVPLNQTLENWSVLQRLRIPSRLIVFPDANHWIMKGEDSRFFYSEVQAWLKKYLTDGASQ